MIIEKVIAAPLETNAYLIGCEKSHKAIVIDPGHDSTERLLLLIKKHELTVIGIYLTHSHFDHIADVARLKREMGWPVYIHSEDAGNLIDPGSDGIPNTYGIEGVEPDGYIEDGEQRQVGELQFRVIHTPGHSRGGVLLYFYNEKVLISGDTLFRGTYGRTDLPTSDPKMMKASLEKIKHLPDDLVVYPGHGGLTTIGREQKWL